jgi:hypothetical protein
MDQWEGRGGWRERVTVTEYVIIKPIKILFKKSNVKDIYTFGFCPSFPEANLRLCRWGC